MDKKSPPPQSSDKPTATDEFGAELSEEVSKIKSELPETDLDKVAGGNLPYPYKRGVNG